MATYLIGDVQGCFASLQKLLQKIEFSPSTDTVYLLGDIVNRGPQSLETLRYCRDKEGSVQVLLGNHDLHLLACAHQVRLPGRRDTLNPVLQAADRDDLLPWLARQPLARHLRSQQGQDLLLVHAGVLPSWSLQNTLDYAAEVQSQLRGPELQSFLEQMYGNTPDIWSPDLTGMERWRIIVNALTRLRFCSAQGQMDFSSSESASAAPAGLMPWFDCPHRASQTTCIAFGHWSTLGLRNEEFLIALDTGCIWGGSLTALEISMADFQQRHIHQLPCPQVQAPGQS